MGPKEIIDSRLLQTPEEPQRLIPSTDGRKLKEALAAANFQSNKSTTAELAAIRQEFSLFQASFEAEAKRIGPRPRPIRPWASLCCLPS
jgi:hypothetical protein